MDNENSEYKTVRSLVRGLSIINTINRFDGGVRIQELSEATKIHRTTVRRLLETLIEEGYVRRSDSDDSFRLTMKVRELSEGFRDEQWVSQLGAPLLADLLQEVVWPTDLSSLDGDAMVIRETTHRFSRLSFHRSMVGRRLPLLLTASGRAYIANCPEAERRNLLLLLASQDNQSGELARNKAYVKKVVEKTRERGYGWNYGDWGEEGKIAAIALPIKQGKKVLGCLNLVYIAKAMTIDEAASRYLPALERCVSRIESQLPKPTRKRRTKSMGD